jgi:biotin carboxyl carrier protein
VHDPRLRALLQALGSAALGIGLGLGILAVGFVVSRVTLADTTIVGTSTNATAVGPASSPSSTAHIVASAAPTTAAVAAATVAPTPAATAPPAATASPVRTPTATADPLTFELYTNGGRRFAAFVLPAGPYTITSPIAGTVSIAMYQYLEGDVRVGSNIPELPFYPYVTVSGSERKIVLRPSSLQAGVKLLVSNGQKIGVGDALFSITDLSPSSWRTFYDRNLDAPVIASVLSTSTGAEVDPLSIFKR